MLNRLHELLLSEGQQARGLDVHFLPLQNVDQLELLLEGTEQFSLPIVRANNAHTHTAAANTHTHTHMHFDMISS